MFHDTNIQGKQAKTYLLEAYFMLIVVIVFGTKLRVLLARRAAATSWLFA